jgi:hypothetical protein
MRAYERNLHLILTSFSRRCLRRIVNKPSCPCELLAAPYFEHLIMAQ